MNEKIEDPFGMSSMVTTWMQSMNDFYTRLAGKTDGHQPGADPANESDHNAAPKTQQAIENTLKNWQRMASAISTPESVEALLKGSGTMPEVLMKLAQTSMGSMIELQQSVIQRLGRVGESTKAYQFQNIDENISRIWTDIYEKEFRQFFPHPAARFDAHLPGKSQPGGRQIQPVSVYPVGISQFAGDALHPFHAGHAGKSGRNG
jgi:hypothetical protein